MIKNVFLIVISIFTTSCALDAGFEDKIHASFEPEPKPTESFVYKTVNQNQLKIHYFKPDPQRIPGKNPCVIMIHGGGWQGGDASSFYRWCRFLSEQGVSAFSVSYRLASEEKGISPHVCLEDCKSAVRWVRKNAVELGINSKMIAVGGSSAGGHLSAACATIKDFNDESDDTSISCIPNLLLLGSPVIDNGPTGWGFDKVSEYWESFSPVHNLNNHLPPACVIMGEVDPLVSLDSVEEFGKAVTASKQDFQWYVLVKKGHAIFSREKSQLTPELMYIFYQWNCFLAEHGFTEKPSPPAEDFKVEVVRRKVSNAVQKKTVTSGTQLINNLEAGKS